MAVHARVRRLDNGNVELAVVAKGQATLHELTPSSALGLYDELSALVASGALDATQGGGSSSGATHSGGR